MHTTFPDRRRRAVLPSAALLFLVLGAPALAAREETSLPLIVSAGKHERRACPVRVDVSEAQAPTWLREAVESGAALTIAAEASGKSARVQAERRPNADGATIRLTWILPEPLAAGSEARYLLSREPGNARPASPWTWTETSAGGHELKRAGTEGRPEAPVFRYNARPVSQPGYEAQARDGYIHPAYSPSGALITGDFSKQHPHHRGFFFAYAKADIGDFHTDFWNIHRKVGGVRSEGVDRTEAGPVLARLTTRQRWHVIEPRSEPRPVLDERWDIEVYDAPEAGGWLWDLTSTQVARDEPIVLPPYRYGGMAYRGPEPFLEKGKLDVRTSEGRGRVDGDQKPTRWVDLTGPIAEGSDRYAGAMVADHPDNPHHPTVARIHPTALPFFAYTPSHDKTLTLPARTPVVFRYRILIHDGHPDPKLDERVWRDFAEPPSVRPAHEPAAGCR